MNFPLFIARRIFTAGDDSQQVSRPAIRIATIGVAIGLAVMIVTVSVITGFKHTIRDKITGFGTHIQIQNFMALQTGSMAPICISDTLLKQVEAIPNVRHIDKYTLAQGLLKTEHDFLGVTFKGIDSHYDTSFLKTSIKEGKLPAFSDKKSTNEIVISQQIAQKLNLKVGDKVYAYFIAYDDVKVRRFTVSGCYETNMKQFDEILCFTGYSVPVKLNGWESDQCSGVEILLDDFDRLSETADKVVSIVNRQIDRYGETLSSQTIFEAYPQVFSWLSLLDINVWIILALMICVAGFTMISGLLIIILERTQMIGQLKALGARNCTIRHTFLWFSVFIIGRGLLFGNLIGIGLVLIQQHQGIIKLDPASYYVDTAPVELYLPSVVILNIATMVACVFVLIAPSFLVSHIHPAKSMRF